MGILSAEQMAQIAAEDSADQASPKGPESAPVAESAQGRAVYEEDAPPPETAAQPAAPVSRPTFKAKVYGQEEEVPVILEDGQVNPEIVKRYQQAGAFYQVAEKAARLEKELEELRGRPATTAPAAAPQAADQQISNIDTLLAQLPADDPYTQVLRGMRQELVSYRTEAEQIKQREMSAAVQRERERLETEEKDIREKFQVNDEALNLIRQITYARWQAGDMTPLTKVAEEFYGHIAKAREEGVTQWKDKHRVKGAPPAAQEGAPPQGGPRPAPLSLEKGDVRRAALAHLEAIGA